MGGGLSQAGDGCESVRPERLGEWRSQIAAGRRLGPRIRYSGPAVSGTGWPTSLPARTEPEAALAVARLRALRVDFVKVYDGISRAAYQRLAHDSRVAGLTFAGHVPDDVGPVDALRAGQRSIEHLRDPLLVCFVRRPPDGRPLLRPRQLGPGRSSPGAARPIAQCPALIRRAARRATPG